MKHAGQKSVKEELPEQRKGLKRAVECWLKVQTHVWELDVVRSSRTTRTKGPLEFSLQRTFVLFTAAQILKNCV